MFCFPKGYLWWIPPERVPPLGVRSAIILWRNLQQDLVKFEALLPHSVEWSNLMRSITSDQKYQIKYAPSTPLF